MVGVQETLDSKISPIVLEFSEVRFFEGSGKILRSLLTVNSLDLGVVSYGEYRFVAGRNRLGHQLVKRHLEKLFRRIPTLLAEDERIECVTLPVYARLLFDGSLLSMLVDMLRLHPEVVAAKICVEFSADLLYEDLAAAKKKMDELRALGVRVALFEVGDSFCPTFRLSEIGFDLAFLDPYAVEALGKESGAGMVGSLVRYLHDLRVRVIAPGLESEEGIEAAKSIGADGYTTDAVSYDNAARGGASDGE